MNIHFDADTSCFHLQTPEMSYAFRVTPDGRLLHLYWGGALNDSASLRAPASEPPQDLDPADGVNQPYLPDYEIPTMEPGDFSDPVLLAVQPDGVRSLRLALSEQTARVVRTALSLLGIKVPERM